MAKSVSKKIWIGVIGIAAVVLAAVVLFDAFGRAKTAEKSGFAMGSVVTVKLYGTKDAAAADDILAEIEREENNSISRYKDGSEIHILNRNGMAELSEHTVDILRIALQLSADSGGAFDVTVGRLTSLWDFDNGAMGVPFENDIEAALSVCGSDKITVNGSRFTLGEGQILDLGALGKGLACDDAAAVLAKNGIDGAVVSVGGSVLTYGTNPKGEDWTVGIRTPEPEDNSLALRLKISGMAFISTSGDYEKYFIQDGVTYHHILSPQTGYPAESGLKSVTVVSDSGLLSDALSTACFVLGTEDSGALLEKYGAEAVFIDKQNRVFVTDGLFDRCSAETDAYTLYPYGT